jgi:L-iditol 2-dehydrogenase
MINRCFYLDGEHRLTLREEAVPVPAPDEALIHIRANGICGSDVHFFHEGRLGNFVVQAPYIPGHECSGEIAALGSAVQGLSMGQWVTIEPGIPCGRCETCKSGRYNLCPRVRFLSEPGVNGTFCDYVTVRADMVYPLPKGLSLEQGALAEPLAVAVHGVNLAGAVRGKTAAILGTGPIGLMTMLAFKAAGGGPALCFDINPTRLARAKALGANAAYDNRESGDLRNICEVAFETAGSPATTAQLFDVVRPGGVAVQIGWPSKNKVEINIANCIEKEITYRGLNRYASAFPTALTWLAEGRVPGEKLISHRHPFAQTPDAFRFTAGHPDEVIKMMVVQEG